MQQRLIPADEMMTCCIQTADCPRSAFTFTGDFQSIIDVHRERSGRSSPPIHPSTTYTIPEPSALTSQRFFTAPIPGGVDWNWVKWAGQVVVYSLFGFICDFLAFHHGCR